LRWFGKKPAAAANNGGHSKNQRIAAGVFLFAMIILVLEKDECL
jgi:hypothetical protein